jgi:hypothetical protein
MTRIRALGLLSGGLDSALAARLLLDQGIDVVGLHLESPTACRSDVREVARDLGIPLEVRAKGEEYLRLLRAPRFGYGKNMNPCIDCRAFMFALAGPVMESVGAAFLFTGEVVGQRPMSQTQHAIRLVEREAGLEGKVLRPLSAHVLPETEAEQRGWVDRSRLLGLFGRGRTAQLALADAYGLAHYQSPGGGCLLTDAIFSRKLVDLFEHTPAGQESMDDVALLRLGRHFRVGDALKIVLGRDRDENRALAALMHPGWWSIEPDGFNGPTALVCGPRTEKTLEQAIGLIVRYTRDPRPELRVRWRDEEGRWRQRSLENAVAVGVGPAATDSGNP